MHTELVACGHCDIQMTSSPSLRVGSLSDLSWGEELKAQIAVGRICNRPPLYR